MALNLAVGDFARYVVDGRTVFSGRLAYTRGMWSGIITRQGARVDEVLTSHVRPVNTKEDA